MLITALFVIDPNWKQPRCPLTGEWINKLVYTYDETLLNRKEGTAEAPNGDESQDNYAE